MGVARPGCCHPSLPRGSWGEPRARRQPQSSRRVVGGPAGGAHCCPRPGVWAGSCSRREPGSPTPRPPALRAAPPPAAPLCLCLGPGAHGERRPLSSKAQPVSGPGRQPPGQAQPHWPGEPRAPATLNLGLKDEPGFLGQGEGTARGEPRRPVARGSVRPWPGRGSCGEMDRRVYEPPMGHKRTGRGATSQEGGVGQGTATSRTPCMPGGKGGGLGGGPKVSLGEQSVGCMGTPRDVVRRDPGQPGESPGDESPLRELRGSGGAPGFWGDQGAESGRGRRERPGVPSP